MSNINARFTDITSETRTNSNNTLLIGLDKKLEFLILDYGNYVLTSLESQEINDRDEKVRRISKLIDKYKSLAVDNFLLQSRNLQEGKSALNPKDSTNEYKIMVRIWDKTTTELDIEINKALA